jgi:hypothetical protein
MRENLTKLTILQLLFLSQRVILVKECKKPDLSLTNSLKNLTTVTTR